MDLSLVPYTGEREEREEVEVEAEGGGDGGRYRECLRNHAAAMGGQAYDGCGEFMPGGDEGSLEALKCAACGCHRNFHRREGISAATPRPLLLYGPSAWNPGKHQPPPPPTPQFPAFLPLPYHAMQPPPLAAAPPPPLPPCREAAPPDRGYRAGSETPPRREEAPDEAALGASARKRFRTKFTAEQKEKMQAFAEKLGWRVPKQDDVALDEFCLQIGVKRHVLKVWMHNNKNHLSSSSSSSSSASQPAAAAVPAPTAADPTTRDAVSALPIRV